MKAFVIAAEIIAAISLLADPVAAQNATREATGEPVAIQMAKEVIGEPKKNSDDPVALQTAKTTWSERTMTVTAYNSVPEQTDGSPCIAANGDDICALRDAGSESCAGHFPFGTELEIPGFGTCVVRDRTHPRFSDRVDIYFGGKERIPAAFDWGVRRLRVRIAH